MLKPAETIAILQKQPDAQSFAAGEVIFTEGETGNVMYGILEGEVELLVDGKVVETIIRGDVFGEGALVHVDHQRQSTAIAKTDCKLASLDQNRFLFAIENTPMFAIEVMRSYSDRLYRFKHIS
ncbi:cyclic nucleotide-binding domain-containing protein [Acaryochloris sp. CCMEE 5410]|uniref:cyclic nucleotide-binding domain-containing protein n=1 Tax=Acaryochloris sp. CCMEE 5410 TaxID=310037 RepID=UPI000248439A|nr:cyclic nucleotide-binding domain-containing protein [Acaryochloris sp. CCMEE 5410]KAI9129276.1 cyclic nucleotide-binding domain-containing protein [Acaryochloris sp. CCMEE 5410]